MINTLLSTALTTSGCTLILYEAEQLANVLTDQSKPDDVIGLILETDSLDLEPAGNARAEHYRPTVDILKQCNPEDLASTNESIMISLLAICKLFIYTLERSANFQKIGTVRLQKVNENKFDANLIGWSMSLDLIPIENALHC